MDTMQQVYLWSILGSLLGAAGCFVLYAYSRATRALIAVYEDLVAAQREALESYEDYIVAISQAAACGFRHDGDVLVKVAKALDETNPDDPKMMRLSDSVAGFAAKVYAFAAVFDERSWDVQVSSADNHESKEEVECCTEKK